MIGKTVSHYKIIEKIGEGGMGVVYKAHHTRLDKVVALKFLPSHLSSSADAKMRFIHEAKTASALDHPNICTIHDIDESPDGGMFIAMAYYEGETLRARVERGSLDVDQALDIVAQIASGLSQAHARGIVHRDIKPANILITNDGVAKILDFGLAKLGGQTKVTKTGTTVGTVAYMSPEQARGEEVDARSDIFSLGAVMYELLTGQLPFPGEHEVAILHQIMNDEPPPLSQHKPELPSRLQGCVEKTLRKDAADRYSSAADFLGDLRAIQAEMANSPGERRRRNVGARAALLALAITLVAVGGYFAYQRFRPSADSQVTPRREETFVVVVAPFWGQNAEALEEGRVMQALVERRLIEELGGEKGVRIFGKKDISDIPRSHDDAKKLGKERGATMVLWGEVLVLRAEVEIQPYMTVVKRLTSLLPATSTEAMQASLDEPNQLDLRKAKATDVGNVALIVAGTFYRRKDPDKALLLLRRISPPTPASLVGQAGVFADRDSREAERLYREAIDLDSTYAPASNGLGWVYNSQGKYDEAIAWHQKAIAHDPEFVYPYNNMGNAYYEQCKYEEAIAWYQKAIARDPEFVYPYNNMGLAYYKQSKYEEAIAWYQKAIARDPEYLHPYNNMGLACHKQSKYEEAIAWYQKAIAIDPKDASAYNMTGHVYSTQSKNDEAITWYKKAIDVDPEYPDPYANMGDVYYYQRRYDEAMTWYKKAIDLDPDLPAGYTGLANVYLHQGKTYQAVAAYQRALDVDPDNAGYTYIRMGAAYSIEGKHGEAIWAYKKAADVDPDFLGNAYLMIGYAYSSQGKYSEAIAAFTKAADLNPDFAGSAYLAIGRAYSSEGEYNEAIAACQKAVDLGLPSELARQALELIEKIRSR